MGVINNRLASIEAGQARSEAQQSSIQEELRRMVSLLDRMVRVEERQANADKRLDQVIEMTEANNAELGTWRTTRKIIAWCAGITSTVLGAIAIKHWG